MAPTPTESSNNSSAAPSPKVGAAAPGTMSLDAAQHSPLSPAATPPGVGAHDRSSPHGQGSPNFPNNMNRGFRSNNGAPGNSYRDNQYNSNNRQGGQGGQGGGGGVRNANRRPPMQQTSFPRGAGMVDGHMPHMGGQPQQMQMHGGGVRDMNRGGGVGYGSHQQLPPPQLQQQQFIAYDPYNPQMVVPNQMPQGQYGIPGAMSGGMPVGGMQGFQTQPHQQLPQGRQQSASPLQQQQQMFVPPGQQQHPQQQMVYPQHVMMHNSQPGQQR